MAVISLALAHLLRDAGLTWKPAYGDRFCVPDRDMDDQVFVIADMTVDVHDLPQGRVIGFNGTLEWALDSLEQHEVLWLPREDQLREQLGVAFRRLDQPVEQGKPEEPAQQDLPPHRDVESGTASERGRPYRVTFQLGDDILTVHADQAEEAYGRAVLVVLNQDGARAGQ